MTGAEQGFLLLTSPLGDPNRHVLSASQLRRLRERVRGHSPQNPDRDLEPGDLMRLGYVPEEAEWIWSLLSQEELLKRYLNRGQRYGCTPLTWLTEGYPRRVLDALGGESPGSIWAKGDMALLGKPRIALVGSRELRPENGEFAREAGRQAALQGYVLLSGNARGADRTAQEACLQWGGSVISVVADRLCDHKERKGVLYLSEDGFDLPFSAQRALSRNRLIHSMAEVTLVAQCNFRKGGTWGGSQRNLRGGWSRLVCFDDGSEAVQALCREGAVTADLEMLKELKQL